MRRYPEWWSLVLSGSAWLILIAAPASRHGLTGWLLMVMAMMVPFVGGPICATAQKSLWRRRDRAMALFVAGFVGPWLLLGTASIRLPLPSVLWLVFIAVAWELTPHKRRARASCHRTVPLAMAGWRADRDCVSYGWTIGVACVASCWAWMLVVAASGHSPALMVLVSLMMLSRRLREVYGSPLHAHVIQ